MDPTPPPSPPRPPSAGALVLSPESQPAEMRDSIELGLAVLDVEPRPVSVLLTPGDVPGLTGELVAQLLEVAGQAPDRLVIPTHEGHRGHPIVLPWSVAIGIRDLPDDAGVNVLVERHQADVLEVPISARASSTISTPPATWSDGSREPLTDTHVHRPQ